MTAQSLNPRRTIGVRSGPAKGLTARDVVRSSGEGEGVGTAKYDMTTIDEELVKDSIDFMKKAKDSGKPFFLWHNTTRMHVFTFLAAKYKATDEFRHKLWSRRSGDGAA